MTEIYNKTEKEITQELLDNMPAKYQKTVGFPIYDFMRAIAIFLKKILTTVSTVLSWQNVDNMTGESLTRWCSQRRGIERKTATKSTTKLVTTGTGFSISAGTIIGESEDGIQFATISDIESETGMEEIEVECTVAGTIGNLPAGTIQKIPVSIDGLSTVNNFEDANGGYDEESDDALRQRYYEDLRLPIVSGNKNHYKAWAKEVSGVADAKVKSLWNGDNTVKAIILDEETLIPSDELVSNVQTYIDPLEHWGEGYGQAPCGAYCTVAKPIKKDITVSATIQIKVGFTLEVVQANIESALKDYFKSIAFDDDCLVSYAQISACLLSSTGVKDHSNLLLNGDTDNISLLDSATDTEVAVLTNLQLTQA